jgi:hypothetical protein
VAAPRPRADPDVVFEDHVAVVFGAFDFYIVHELSDHRRVVVSGEDHDFRPEHDLAADNDFRLRRQQRRPYAEIHIVSHANIFVGISSLGVEAEIPAMCGEQRTLQMHEQTAHHLFRKKVRRCGDAFQISHGASLPRSAHTGTR